MTPAQLSSLKADILANVATRPIADMGALAAYYNANSAASIYRPSIPVPELNTAIVWSEFMALPVQTQNAYFALIQGGTVDATKPNVRAGFGSIFVGLVSLTNLTTLAQRLATRFESAFITANVSSAFGTVVAVSDIAAALGS